MIVKVGLDGQAYVDYAPVSRDELADRVRALEGADAFVTYYRESPETDGTAAAEETLRALIDLKPVIQLGHQAPSEWGRLDWVEVEEAPQVSRFFLARGEKFLVSAPPSGAEPKPAVLVGGPLPQDVEDRCLGELDLLLRSDRVIETPYHRPELSFDEAEQSRPSLHLRFAYDRGRWAASYPGGEVPSHIASFHQDLWRFATRFVAGFERGGRPLPPDEARRLFS